MLNKFKQFLSGNTDATATQVEQPTAQADIEKEVVNMTTATEQPIAAENTSADLAAQLASSTSALTELQASFAELTTKFEAAQAALAVVENEKKELATKAAEARLVARKESLEATVGTIKAAELLTTLEVLDDTAFAAVVSTMKVNLDAEAKSAAFTEAGVTAEAKEVKPTHFKNYIKTK